MKRGIKVEGAYDWHDISVLRISKARGKLTLDEIEDTLRYGNNNMCAATTPSFSTVRRPRWTAPASLMRMSLPGTR